MVSLTRLLQSTMLVALGYAGAGTAQTERRLPEGTYTLKFCYPSCEDSTSVVGTGTLVLVDGDIRHRMTRALADSLRGDLNFLLFGRKAPPNACFHVSAQRTVAGQEYYVGIIRASLTIARALPNDSVGIGLYASPDAYFDAIVSIDSSGVLDGVGHQFNWDGSKAPVTRLTGRRTGPPDPRECVPGSPVR
jgi:hypothetical protein